MADIFTFTEAEFLDSDLLKFIIGMAGLAKTATSVHFYQERNIPLLYLTATNKLKRAAIERFGIQAMTVASGLFTTDRGVFYCEEKLPEIKNIIIDEILLTDRKVIDWIKNHRGEYNIIVLTDIHQMLTPGESKRTLKELIDLMNEPYSLVYEGTQTRRAIDKETEDMYTKLYNAAGHKCDEFPRSIRSKRFPVMRYDEMEFNLNDVYITHLNATEDFLYRDKKLSDGFYHEDQLIPKGSIANKPPKSSKNYPIMSQQQAEKTRASAYYQLQNIGSATRYQGSEVYPDQKLYFIITPNSRVSNREWYTVVTRCKTIDSIVIVVHEEYKERLTSFRGKKIKDFATLSLEGDIE